MLRVDHGDARFPELDLLAVGEVVDRLNFPERKRRQEAVLAVGLDLETRELSFTAQDVKSLVVVQLRRVLLPDMQLPRMRALCQN